MIEKNLQSKIKLLNKRFYGLLLRLQGYKSTNNIVFNSHKAIYFPIPKVASSSLKILSKQILKLEKGSPHQTKFPHICIEELGQEPYQEYFKFCFVRNPWDRLISTYTTKVVGGKIINDPVYGPWIYQLTSRLVDIKTGNIPFCRYPMILENMSFEEFVFALADIPDDKVDKHLRSQYTFITDNNGKILVDFVGKFESLKEDFDWICKQIGLNNVTLPHKRDEPRQKFGRKDYLEYYTPKTWEIVRQRYQKDIEMFGYDAETFEIN